MVYLRLAKAVDTPLSIKKTADELVNSDAKED
jgi:hypothetical protein